ncbi:LysR family transcriptional regulator [Ligilactobacillus sp. Marseille-Q7487]|uniref:LysR family transcriptional regulator n=1 Tax=Ligilactobacillus sp. Marseille-Q7487 TaxID=3022128 RepID=UPI0015B4DF35|nr:LysR family transcriptional regulator [Ligilactobacillus sp. Marseille-Q7487]
MNFKQLEYFLAIAEEKQFSAAAKRLNISQPPLSYQIKMLEKELGVELFERTPRGIKLTPEGKLLAKYAQQIIDLEQLARTRVQKHSNGTTGTISLGTVSSSGDVMPNANLQVFCQAYPDVNFEIYEDNTFGIIDKLQHSLLDAAIVRTPFNAQGLNVHYFAQEEMVVVVSNNYPDLANLPQSFDITTLSQYPLIIYRRFSTIFKETFTHYGLNPFIAVRCDDARTAIRWAEMNMGLALVPSSIAKLNAKGLTRIIPVKQDSWKTQMALIWPKDKLTTPLMKKFIAQFSES